jgi:hypothetical protein
LLAGITVGWSDRNKGANTPPCGDLVGAVRHRHGGRRLDALPREVSR